MTVSISNLNFLWANSNNIYTAIGANVNTSAYAANSAVIRIKANGNTIYKVDGAGNQTLNNVIANVITANSMSISNVIASRVTANIAGDINSNFIYANTITAINVTASLLTVGRVVANTLTANVITLTAMNVANLPSPTSGGRATVNDANAKSFFTTVIAGGANIVPVFANGTHWLIG